MCRLSVACRFAHKLTTVFLLPRVRGLPAATQKWEAAHRGWRLYEGTVARVGLKSFRDDLWDPIQDVGIPENRHMGPPLSVGAFASLLRDPIVRFTNVADRALVARLYEGTLSTVLGSAAALTFDNRGWADDEMLGLAKLLPLFSRLRSLTIGGNKFGRLGLEAFCMALIGLTANVPTGPYMPTAVGRPPSTELVVEACQSVLASLTSLDLSGTRFCEGVAPKEAAHPLQLLAWVCSPFKAGDAAPASHGRHDLLSHIRPAALPNLTELRMERCRLTTRDLLIFCKALRPKALHNLTRLRLDGNELMKSTAVPLIQALDDGAMPQLSTVTGLDGGVLGSEVVSLREVKAMRDKMDSIRWWDDNAVRKMGVAERRSKEVELIDKILDEKVARLEKWRKAQAERRDRRKGSK